MFNADITDREMGAPACVHCGDNAYGYRLCPPCEAEEAWLEGKETMDGLLRQIREIPEVLKQITGYTRTIGKAA